MKTVEQAHAAGRRDGEQGLGPLPPRNGPPGSRAHQLHRAYMQSYRDSLIARVGIPERRRNRAARPKPRKAPRAKRIRRSKATARSSAGKRVTTVTNSKVVRVTNPRVVLYATKPGKKRLKYLGHGKFGERGRAQLFASVALANQAGRTLRDAFPQALRGWTVTAGAEPAESSGRTHRRRLPQGVDPAERLYRDQARRDAEAAHRWLSKQAG